jgi:hypothetical protein
MIQYYETTRKYATPVLVLVAVVLAVAATTESTLAFSQSKVKLRQNKRIGKGMCVVCGRYVQMKQQIEKFRFRSNNRNIRCSTQLTAEMVVSPISKLLFNEQQL